ncbi:MAG: histidine kinase dimerization/phospho-acceptor domain-containing protein, partial [Dorea sp.]
DANLQQLKKMGRYVVVEPTLKGFESNIQNADAESWRNTVENHRNSEDDFIFAAAVDTNYPIQDKFYSDWKNYETYGKGIRVLIVEGIVSALLFVVGLIWLTIIAGRKREDNEIHLVRLDRWKTELSAGLAIVFTLLPAGLGIAFLLDTGMFNMLYYFEEGGSYGLCAIYIVAVTAIEVVAFAFFLIGYLSLVRRIKAHTLWKDSILRKVVSFVRYTFSHIHGIWKTLLIFGVFIVMHWFLVGLALAYCYSGSPGIFLVIMVIVEIVAAVYLVTYAIGREKIKTGIQNIAAGDVEYKIPTDKMLPEHKEIAEKVNSIGDGLDAAVEKSMKSERLKTDLITNVSHDIKTPLTSIINYVDLLKKEKFEDPKVQRYLEILDQKSQRLKTLTEDVVEASKVSSGNISLEYMQINFVEMIQQTSGEFEEKFAKRRLKEILVLPEKEVVIRVDGRRTWRVLENIYNNAAKYAMEGSRVYADLKVVGYEAVFTLKNISEQPLNISADELTERFIRGDISRSTEGSGLGLSIARSLTQMQGGIFEVYLDGDLFKVTIKFPVV